MITKTPRQPTICISHWMAFSILFLHLCIQGCNQENESSTKNRAQQVSRSTTDGPVTLSQTVSSVQIDLGKKIHIEVVVEAKQGVTVEVYDYSFALREDDRAFQYRAVRSDKKEAFPIQDEMLRWTYQYDLDFYLAGSYELPAPVVTFFTEQADPSTQDSDTELSELTIEPITIIVNDPSAATLTQQELENIITLNPIELPKPWSRWWWLGPMVAVIPIALLLWVLRKARQQRLARLATPIPADVWAHRQITKLVADDLLAKGLIQEFYYRISGIVRGYIERRFHVHAPEMTTEEFLVTVKEDSRFNEKQPGGLMGFLDACDLVKYAKQIPAQSEADMILSAAKRFIETTRERAIDYDQPKLATHAGQEFAA